MTQRCEYCGARFEPTGKKRKTHEHLMPKSMGGVLTIPVCYSCNHDRGCSMTDEHFLQFVISHPQMWSAAIKNTQTEKFEAYIGDHPYLKRLPIIREAMLMKGTPKIKTIHRRRTFKKKTKHRRRTSKIKTMEPSLKPPRSTRFYGLRSQETRPKLPRMTRKNKRWRTQKPQHEPFEDNSRQVEITMIRSRIPGAMEKNRRVLKARLKRLNMMNWDDHMDAMLRLRIERRRTEIPLKL